jgi:hypothetical protein
MLVAMGEKCVDLHHLLRETIFTEVAANSLNFDTTAAGDNVQLYDVVFVDQAGFAAPVSSFTEYKNKS